MMMLWLIFLLVICNSGFFLIMGLWVYMYDIVVGLFWIFCCYWVILDRVDIVIYRL